MMFDYKPMKLACQLEPIQKCTYINIWVSKFKYLGHGWRPYWILAKIRHEYFIVSKYIYLSNILREYSLKWAMYFQRNQRWVIVINFTLKNKHQWNFNENANISFRKMHLKISFAVWRRFCPGRDELIQLFMVNRYKWQYMLLSLMWFVNV